MSIDEKGGRWTTIWTTILLVAGVILFVFGLAGLTYDDFVGRTTREDAAVARRHARVVMTLGAGLLTVGYLCRDHAR